MNYPESIKILIEDLSELPTVGPKTAERFAVYLLKQPQEKLESLAKHIYDLKKDIKVCSRCFALSSQNPCETCADEKRDKNLLCIVSGFSEMAAIEASRAYRGLYFIIGKNIRIEEGEQESLGLKKLKERLGEGNIKEVILALSPTIEGETLGLYLARILKSYKIKLTKLARGLPMGADIEYADEITLNNALKNRNEIS